MFKLGKIIGNVGTKLRNNNIIIMQCKRPECVINIGFLLRKFKLHKFSTIAQFLTVLGS